MNGQGKSPGQRGADIDCIVGVEIASEDPYGGKELDHGRQNPSLGGRSQLANVDDDGAEIQTDTNFDDDTSDDEHGNVDGGCFDGGTEAGDAKADGHCAWSTNRIGETARKYGDDGRKTEDTMRPWRIAEVVAMSFRKNSMSATGPMMPVSNLED